MSAYAVSASRSEAAHAASQVLLPDATQPPACAVDAVVAAVLAIAAKHPGAFLGAASLLLGGTGEGLLAIDGRARQPGLGSPRPRGFLDDASVPAAARIAAPTLPAALVVAHAGRGERTLSQLARAGVASARHEGDVDPERAETIEAFGREGAAVLRVGNLHEALLRASARSVGGLLSAEDLEAARPEVVPSARVSFEARDWAFLPWFDRAPNALAGSDAEATIAESVRVASSPTETAVVCAVDTRGAFAIAAVQLVAGGVALPSTGLYAPPLASAVMRGVPRVAAGAVLPAAAAIGLASARKSNSPIDLAVGVAGPGDCEEVFLQLARGLSAPDAITDDVIARPRARRGDAGPVLETTHERSFGIACGVSLDGRKHARAVFDPRR